MIELWYSKEIMTSSLDVQNGGWPFDIFKRLCNFVQKHTAKI